GAFPVFGSTITLDGTWYEFNFGLATSTATGCFNTGAITDCTLTQNPVANVSNTSPWTFTGAASLFVLDLGDVGDRFEVFDNTVSLGMTSNISNTGGNPCGSPGTLDIACSQGNAAYSRGTFDLGSGDHSITINVIQNATNTTFGQAVFNATA